MRALPACVRGGFAPALVRNALSKTRRAGYMWHFAFGKLVAYTNMLCSDLYVCMLLCMLVEVQMEGEMRRRLTIGV
jgi:hypothetical protein